MSVEMAAFSSAESRPGRSLIAAQCAQQQVRTTPRSLPALQSPVSCSTDDSLKLARGLARALIAVQKAQQQAGPQQCQGLGKAA